MSKREEVTSFGEMLSQLMSGESIDTLREKARAETEASHTKCISEIPFEGNTETIGFDSLIPKEMIQELLELHKKTYDLVLKAEAIDTNNFINKDDSHASVQFIRFFEVLAQVGHDTLALANINKFDKDTIDKMAIENDMSVLELSYALMLRGINN